MFIGYHKYNEPLHPEFLKIERKRVGIILFIFVVSTLVIPVLHQLIPNLLRDQFNNREFVPVVFFWWLSFLLFETLAFARMSWMIKNERTVSKRVLILNLLLEFGLPAIILYNIVKYDNSLLVLEYDGLTFYFLLLMLSAMHLDFKISLGAGILACCGYFGVSYWGIQFLKPTGDVDQMIEIYSMRSLGLLSAGVIAGIVASEIQKRVNNLLKAKDHQNEIESLLGQQLSKDVAKELILHRNDKVGQKVTGSIMFLDIRNFTVMADHQSPEQTIEFQNAIFDPLIRIIEKNNGIIHQIMGDGFMASFGVAVNNPNHANDAYCAGNQIVEVINHCRDSIDGNKTRVGIGLHCGEVVAGNIGNEIRKQFSLAGKNVIIASRIEQLNKKFNSQFLVSESIANQLNGRHNKLINLGKVKIKGIDDKMVILQVV
ncbi:adenylate/guanylate cyclase domain-containing protein [Labilibaculum antarcticum]|uniref:Adenylate/guanylate cyclase domain-containing protein n=1 Tax=Labilibaculum antarcticum TaxID=1717717 RepID=A0A1Y1CM99_9BACT|nr:adenylate/guanylate cyclase domain-containing protein [Labilibaculum antarcticum]BAX81420.1 adenylate/guanylate cyclase domain-containing protein [Labilibaculum antarcticum]